MRKLASILLVLGAAEGASAQDLGWTYKTTVYGWIPGVDTSVDTRFGNIEGDVSPSDALSSLDMAFMAVLSAQRDRWGLVGDLLYTDLSASQETPFALYGEGEVDVKLTALSGYALYRVTSGPRLQFDVGAGFRYFDVDVDVSLSPGLRPGASQSLGDSWTNALVAARLTVPLNESWFLTGFADWGGNGSGDETWQVYAGLGYAFDDRWSTQLGYRHMDIDRDFDGNDVSIALSGLALGVSYSF
ncbi:outer membrane beta-barrel protein [Paracoccus sp. MKU1]|uniref:outer membrane beta-barrel protein n=1 Tax=Paracoccus sp. MKU1 TaxID=1745182 RepID=UPI00071935CA|nr:outer membrane beta-barrel protein [Paracoccus sp. MKU1]KRW97189.1 hypothetical protein AQY21_05035 [Paracoccus sp. MKU1]